MCPRCLTPLVDDLSATVRCRICGKEWPAWKQTCADCLATLRVDPAQAIEAAQDLLAAGVHPWRPEGRSAFHDGPSCTLLRLAARGSLVFLGIDDFIEADVEGPRDAAIPPLTCRDVDGTVLFTLLPYEPVADGLVAFDGDGAPLATYLRAGSGIEVRDETSAPVAALRADPAGYTLVETGGGVLATCGTSDVENEDWVDDQWWLSAPSGDLPLKPLAAVGLVLAAKVLFGRPTPSRVWRDDQPEEWRPFT